MELGGWGLGGDLGRQSECHKVADVAELTLRVFFADTHTLTHTFSEIYSSLIFNISLCTQCADMNTRT